MTNWVLNFCSVYTCTFLFFSSYIVQHNNNYFIKRLNDIEDKVDKLCIKNNIKVNYITDIDNEIKSQINKSK